MEKKSWQKTALRGEIRTAMEVQVSYFSDRLDDECARIRALEIDLLNDSDIARLASIPEYLDNIERVFSLLRIQNRMSAIKKSSNLIQDAVVMIPAVGKQISHLGVSELDTEAFAGYCLLRSTCPGTSAITTGGSFS
jgi:two-component system, sensor histidine kinase YesM